MSEARYDWLDDRWVILSPERDARPNDFASDLDVGVPAPPCPFCSGNEAETPPPILELGRDMNPQRNWMVRVFANKYPATFSPEPTNQERSVPCDKGNVNSPLRNHSQLLLGSHEVIVESAEHLSSISHLSREHMTLAVTAYRDRLAALRNTPGLQYAVLFKNTGPEAGASLVHTHSQIIACNLTPPSYIRLVKRLAEYQAAKGRCYHCDVVRDELSDRRRLIAETGHYVAYCPYASRLPFTVTITPKEHQASFEDLASDHLSEFARLLQRAARWMEALHDASSYNFVVRTMPWSCRQPEIFHWNIEIFPRISKIAGFEWASDCFINTEMPENAAQRYRDIDAMQGGA